VETALKLAIIGANGLITEALLAAIDEHPSLSGEVSLFGTEKSLDQAVEFARQTLLVGDLAHCDFSEYQVVIDSSEEPNDGEWLERAQRAGCVILDVGGHLSGNTQLPPVVAGINDHVLDQVERGDVVVLADAAVVQAVRLLKPVMDRAGLARVSLFSCHAVSGLGRAGVEEMARQTAQMLNGKPARAALFPKQVAFNLLPRSTAEDKATGEQQASAIAATLRQLLGDPALPITVSCCWAPIFYGYTQALHVSTLRELDLKGLKRIYAQSPSIKVKGGERDLPSVVTDASGRDLLTIGGLCANSKNSTDFSLWGVADNLRYGIAGNAVKIIEVLVKRSFISYS
jgi:aspartate-semialdehyde dehydrogenase